MNYIYIHICFYNKIILRWTMHPCNVNKKYEYRIIILSQSHNDYLCNTIYNNICTYYNN